MWQNKIGTVLLGEAVSMKSVRRRYARWWRATGLWACVGAVLWYCWDDAGWIVGRGAVGWDMVKRWVLRSR